MTQVLENPLRSKGIAGLGPLPSHSVEPVKRLLALCPAHGETPLMEASSMAKSLAVGRISLKIEQPRMGLGSFKALGAAYAIACQAEDKVQDSNWENALSGHTFVTASAGNHGLSVAAGARLFGADAVVFIADTVSEAFAERLRQKGARVERSGATYEESMDNAEKAAHENGWTLLSDSSWPGYDELPGFVMEGYLQMADEIVSSLDSVPTHIILQAGVGGMAASLASYFRKAWGKVPQIIVVEPEVAPALMTSVQAGELATCEGPVSSMGRLDCKTPSMIALAGLARDADWFATVSEKDAANAVELLAQFGVETSPSGGAGVAALVAGKLDLPSDAHVLAIISEGPASE